MRNAFTIQEMKSIFDILQGGKIKYVHKANVIGPKYVEVTNAAGEASQVRIVPLIENGFLTNYGNPVSGEKLAEATTRLLIEIDSLKTVLKRLGADYTNFIRFDVCTTDKYLLKSSPDGKYIAPTTSEGNCTINLEEVAALVAASVSVEYLEQHNAISISDGYTAIDTVKMLEDLAALTTK